VPSARYGNICSLTHPEYIRQKARQMRVEKDLTIDEIAERLGISRQTIFYWVKDVPLRRPQRASGGQRLGNEAMQRKYAALRDAAYEEGGAMYEELCGDRTFRDFVCMYIGEGYKRTRHEVQICNSDPKVMVLAQLWLRRLTPRRLSYSVQYHADQDLEELQEFWGRTLGIDPGVIVAQRKSNSGQLARRTWRSRHGVLTIRTSDTYFRARLQAWMDLVKAEWLDLRTDGA
jgi:transposase-like protein